MIMKFHEISEQQFQVTLSKVKHLWHDINNVCFEGKLKEPRILLEPDLSHLISPEYRERMGEGEAMGYCDRDPESGEIVLLFSNKITDPRELMQVVAHEMVHQDLAEEHGYDEMLRIGHSTGFTRYTSIIKRYYNTVLDGAKV
jgi:hypothetical protein